MLCSICNSVSKSPEDSRLLEHHPSFLEVVGDFTDMSFRVHFQSFYDLSVINYYCLLFSQSQLPHLHHGLSVECKIQNAEVMDITDSTHSLLLISEELMQQDTADHLERPVRQLFQY